MTDPNFGTHQEALRVARFRAMIERGPWCLYECLDGSWSICAVDAAAQRDWLIWNLLVVEP